MSTASPTAVRPPRHEHALLPAFVVLSAPAGDGTAASRLKRLLKTALRGYGLKCVVLRDATPAELAAAEESTR